MNMRKTLLITSIATLTSSLQAIDISDDFGDGLDEALWNDTSTPFSTALPGSNVDGQSGGAYSNGSPGLNFTASDYGNGEIRISNVIGSNYIGRLDNDWSITASAVISDPDSNIRNQFDLPGETVALSMGVQNGDNFFDDFGIELSIGDEGWQVFSDEGFEFVEGDEDGNSADTGQNGVFLQIAYTHVDSTLRSFYGDTSPGNLLQTVVIANPENVPFITIALQGFAEANVLLSDQAYWGEFSATGLDILPEPAAAPALAALGLLIARRRR